MLLLLVLLTNADFDLNPLPWQPDPKSAPVAEKAKQRVKNIPRQYKRRIYVPRGGSDRDRARQLGEITISWYNCMVQEYEYYKEADHEELNDFHRHMNRAAYYITLEGPPSVKIIDYGSAMRELRIAESLLRST